MVSADNKRNQTAWSVSLLLAIMQHKGSVQRPKMPFAQLGSTCECFLHRHQTSKARNPGTLKTKLSPSEQVREPQETQKPKLMLANKRENVSLCLYIRIMVISVLSRIFRKLLNTDFNQTLINCSNLNNQIKC